MTRFQHAPLQHVPLLAHVILLPQLTTGKPLPRKKCKRVLPSQGACATARPRAAGAAVLARDEFFACDNDQRIAGRHQLDTVQLNWTVTYAYGCMGCTQVAQRTPVRSGCRSGLSCGYV